MKLREFKQASGVTGFWGNVFWFLKTKEGRLTIIIILLALLIFVFTQSLKCGYSSKDGVWIEYDPVVKEVKINK